MELRIPENLTRNKTRRLKKTVRLPISIVYTFYASAKRIDVKASFYNQALNHRLRVHFPIGENIPYADADAQFILQTRKSGPETYPFVWDKPQGLYPAHGFIQAGEKHSLTVMTGEVSQYEVTDKNSEIILSLLLGTGKFRECKNVLTRKQSWDNPIPTPDAQCTGAHSYHYSIITGDKQKARKQALCSMQPVTADSFEYSEGSLPAIFSMFSVDNPEIRISAFKKHHDSNSIILRLYNPLSRSISTKLVLSGFNPDKYRFVNLEERTCNDFSDCKKTIDLTFTNGEIKTIEFV
jgi:alpha-mannosidase